MRLELKSVRNEDINYMSAKSKHICISYAFANAFYRN